MNAINKVVAYSTSSLWLTIILILSINYKLLLEPIFWGISLPLCLPVGIIMESLYSIMYGLLKKIAKKTKFLCISNVIAFNLYSDYKKNYKKIEKITYVKDKYYQQILSENNIIRNMWMSSMLGLLFCIVYYFNGSKSSIDITKILIWLPCSLPLMWVANIRTEILIKKQKLLLFQKEGEKKYE